QLGRVDSEGVGWVVTGIVLPGQLPETHQGSVDQTQRPFPYLSVTQAGDSSVKQLAFVVGCVLQYTSPAPDAFAFTQQLPETSGGTPTKAIEYRATDHISGHLSAVDLYPFGLFEGIVRTPYPVGYASRQILDLVGQAILEPLTEAAGEVTRPFAHRPDQLFHHLLTGH